MKTLVLLSLLWAAAPVQDPCSRLAVGGLRLGMTSDDVHATVRMDASTSEVLLPDGKWASVEEYTLPGGILHVEYDGLVRRGETRVLLLRQPLAQTYEAVNGLTQRLGPPSSGGDALVHSLQTGPAVWVDSKCDAVLTYYRRPDSWVADESSTVVRIERLSKVTAESPASEAVQAWRAKGSQPLAAATAPPRAESPAASTPATARKANGTTDASMLSASPGRETPPKRTEYIAPLYPNRAKKMGVTGIVTLKVYVQKNGKVALARVASAEPEGYGFEDAAVEAVEQWRFSPATLDGRRVEAQVDVVVQFR